MTENNAAQPGLTDAIRDAIRKAYDDGYNDAKMDPEGTSTYCGQAATKHGTADLLSKLRAPVADERAAFLAWANKEYGIAEGYELNESQRDLLENQKGWMARAALASAPVAGEAIYEIQDDDNAHIWHEVWKDRYDTAAHYVERRVVYLAPPAPQGSEAVLPKTVQHSPGDSQERALWKDGWNDCVRHAEQLSAALSAQPGAQRTGGSDV